jgi:hypothetical protein
MVKQMGGIGVRLRGLTLLVAAIAAAALCLAFTGRAQATQEITQFDTGISSTQAGGHPDIEYEITWTNRLGSELPCNCEDARVLDMHFPTGFIGNPHNVPTCSLTEFSLHSCDPDSQVGVLDIQGGLREVIYNLTPHPNEPGLIGFYVPGAETALFIVLHARTGSDYGLDATTSAVYHLLPVNSISVHIWGVPADPSHDANRFPAGKSGSDFGVTCKPYPEGCFGPVKANVPPAPYLQNPTRCGVPLTASHDVDYYTGTVVTAFSPWPVTTGCDKLTFDPSLKATATTSAADTASGLDVTLNVPQTQSPSAPSPSEIRSVETTLPKGFSLAANAANGKIACADSELAFETEGEAQCPEFAKIGTSTIDSTALPGPIHGGIYIGQPQPGQTYRVFVTADGFATHVKLKGAVDVDQQTGQIVTKFTDMPQSPIQGVDLHFFGSERGIFATPASCGKFPIVTRFVPWDEALADQFSKSQMEIDSGPGGTPCPGATRPFNPRETVGTANNSAGSFSPLTLEVNRDDGDQSPVSLAVSTPPGLLASLRGVSYCPESAIALLAGGGYTGRAEQSAPLCPASSRIGSVMAGAGPGTRPVYVGGDVYLAGPYKGAPLSLVVAVPAVSGPYDFGNVAVRAAISIDPKSAQISAVSDPLPQILSGVPLRIRYLQVKLDRPGLTLNPTRCDPFAIESTIVGDEGAMAQRSSHFQVANCSSLGFAPLLGLSLSGGLRARGHPQIHAVLGANPGDANSRRVTVTLPKGEQLDNAHIGTVCRRPEFVAKDCPSGSLIGHAEVVTPLLDRPIGGPVYLRASSHELPDLVMDLRGQVDLELVGRIDTVNSRLRTTFESVPDAPVTSVTFDLLGRAKGLLVNSQSLCGKPKRATVVMVGQNGGVVTSRPALRSACTTKAKRKRSASQGNRG